MRDQFLRYWNDLAGRVSGPMTFRLYIQPAVAATLAVFAGARDARAGHAPYGWSLLVGARGRRELVREARQDVGRVFLAGLVVDTIYQIVHLRWVYLEEALVVATILALVPYVVVRGPATRVLRRFRFCAKDVE